MHKNIKRTFVVAIFFFAQILLGSTTTEQDFESMRLSNENRDGYYTEIKELINQSNDGWKASTNVAFNFQDSKINQMSSTQVTVELLDSITKFDVSQQYPEIPEDQQNDFDLSVLYPDCLVDETKDIGNCSSDWAMIPVLTIQDKICIKNGIKTSLSVQDALECSNPSENGCISGSPIIAMNYLNINGIVTGGEFLSKEGCKNYKFYDIHHYHSIFSNISLNEERSTTCRNYCDNGSTSDYIEKIQVSNGYGLSGGVESIKKEIIKNGPVIAVISIFEDFMLYKDGVYTFKWGNKLGYLTVKIIGWGITTNGLKYWKVVVPWGETFGQKGIAHIFQGVDMLNIESMVYSINPDLNISTSTN